MNAPRDLPVHGVVVPFTTPRRAHRSTTASTRPAGPGRDASRPAAADQLVGPVGADEAAFRREVGCRVRVSRMSCRLTFAELSQETGLPVPALRRLEDGAAPVDAWHLTLIADALGVTLPGLTGARTPW